MVTSPQRICFILVASLFTATGCKQENPGGSTTTTPVVLHQEWFPYAGYMGEVVAEKRFAKEEGFDLRIEPGSESVDPIKLLITGSADFVVVGGDLLISAVAKGAPLVAIGVINHVSPTCFLASADTKIESPRDFVGKRVGVLPGTNTERVYAMLMKHAGVDRRQVTEISVPFDLQTYILGQYDVRPAFIYDEPISLDQKNIKYTIIKPADFGVRVVGTVYVTRQEVIKRDPQRVQALVDALAKGWQFAVEHPDSAVSDLIARYPDLDRDRELRSFKAGIPYFEGVDGKPLTCSRETWQNTIRGLEEIGEIESGRVSVDGIWADQFVRKSYEKPQQ